MSIEELISALQNARQKVGTDMPVRLVIRGREFGHQHSCIDVQQTEGLHGPIILIFGGEEAAEMDWPSGPLS